MRGVYQTSRAVRIRPPVESSALHENVNEGREVGCQLRLTRVGDSDGKEFVQHIADDFD